MSEFTYVEDDALRADEAANRIDNGAYIGTFVKASKVVSNAKGSEGIELHFEAPGSGRASATLWLRDANGEKLRGPGPNQLGALMFFFGLKAIKSVPGKVMAWVDGPDGKRVQQEVDGEVYPDLCDKRIGLVWRKVLDTSTTGKDREQLEIHLIFHPETRLTMSEIKERRNKPENLEKVLKGLKTVDKRKVQAVEPSQPSLGGLSAGDY